MNSRQRRSVRFLCHLLIVSAAIQSTVAICDESSDQTADESWTPVVKNPAYSKSDGPVVLVDAAHGNFHTIDNRFSAFADLLNADGYQVESAIQTVSQELLSRAQVFVISNAIHGGDGANWILPTPPAFTSDEVNEIVDWVKGGGALLLIADHMPFPGGTADLAKEFDIVFINGYAKRSVNQGGELVFSRSTGSLADHSVTRGRSSGESVEVVKSFTGQAFRIAGTAEALMHMPDDWAVFLPTEAGLIGESTPSISTMGLAQGALLKVGSGRVAVFGEAAMFTAQTWTRNDGSTGQMGLNDPSAPDNAQFVLNVMHWLTKIIDD